MYLYIAGPIFFCNLVFQKVYKDMVKVSQPSNQRNGTSVGCACSHLNIFVSPSTIDARLSNTPWTSKSSPRSTPTRPPPSLPRSLISRTCQTATNICTNIHTNHRTTNHRTSMHTNTRACPSYPSTMLPLYLLRVPSRPPRPTLFRWPCHHHHRR